VPTARKQQYTAPGGGVQVAWYGNYEEIDTRICKANAVLRELYRSVVTKWELSNTTKLSGFYRCLFRLSPRVKNLG